MIPLIEHYMIVHWTGFSYVSGMLDVAAWFHNPASSHDTTHWTLPDSALNWVSRRVDPGILIYSCKVDNSYIFD